jgi:hypothetical protein
VSQDSGILHLENLSRDSRALICFCRLPLFCSNMVLRRTPRHVAMAGAILVTKKAPPLITGLYPSPQYTPLLACTYAVS